MAQRRWRAQTEIRLAYAPRVHRLCYDAVITGMSLIWGLLRRWLGGENRSYCAFTKKSCRGLAGGLDRALPDSKAKATGAVNSRGKLWLPPEDLIPEEGSGF